MASSLSDILSAVQNGVIALNNMAVQIKGSFNNILSRFVTDEANIATNTAAIAALRSKLTAARTYYVRTDGSDSNTGLVNTAGGAFLTLQKAANVIMDTLDLAGYVVTVQIADGTYTAGVIWDRPTVGAKIVGGVVFSGNGATPANVVVADVTGPGFQADGNGCNFSVAGMTIACVYDLYAIYGGQIHVQAGSVVLDGVAVGASIYAYATRFGYIEFEGDTFLNGAGTPEAILEATHLGNIRIATGVQGLTGAMTSTVAFAYSLTGGDITVTGGASFFQISGGIVGNRYLVTAAVIQWSGGGALSFPGTVAGATTFGGQYVV